MKSNLKDDTKKEILQGLNIKLGGDINNLQAACDLQNELANKRDRLESSLSAANDEVPTKLTSAINKAELNSKQIENLKIKSDDFKKRAEDFLSRTQPLLSELDKRFMAISKLEKVLEYFKSYAKIQDLSEQMKNCKDDEQLVLMYSDMKIMCQQYKNSHQANYAKEYTHYWHNILKDNLIKHYDDVLKLLKWPLTSGTDISQVSKEVLNKFNNLTRNLFLIQEPENLLAKAAITGDFSTVQEPSLPIKVLLRPLKKRFAFHFTGSRQTARIDRPEWFLTQTLTWIKDHQIFIKNNVQPIADKLELKNVNALDEFNEGLVALAAERLHTVLAMYHSQNNIVDVDSAFAHAVDETLGFHKELTEITGYESNSVLSVLTKAETFVRWLAVEKKYALSKMDEMLDNEQWFEPVAAGVGAAVGSFVWVPRGSDWFVALLKTIEERYAILPQPGHRIQFLELQLELIEEWRVRLTQIMSAAVDSLKPDSFLVAGPHPLIAIVNTAHHTRSVLLQWAHSLHYLQLYYYRRQFHQFTQQQHSSGQESESSTSSEDEDETDEETFRDESENEKEGSICLEDVETRAKDLALKEVNKRHSIIDPSQYDTRTIANPAVAEPLPEGDGGEDGGVFGDAPALLHHLRQAGLTALVQFLVVEFRDHLHDYKSLKWHAMLTVEQRALCVSSALGRPLSTLCTRLVTLTEMLPPHIGQLFKNELALQLDNCLFREVVICNWFNTGGTIQFTHDVMRNILPAFAGFDNKILEGIPVPRLAETCMLLNFDYDDARRIRTGLAKNDSDTVNRLIAMGLVAITPAEALQILNQRTDLADASSPTSVMELF
ncbi:RAD50-interacting protein 1 [Pieris brassicae]|uniref:RAD50-interacting protein 1 n=1 Tax=Pieris brassicae TaxID=7116 RepID=UPI001E65EEC7|nr:RAD50-interacting protein 1 [Pieris brassicae]